jgi:hypothetical protein
MQGILDGSANAGKETPEIAPIAVATNRGVYHTLRLCRHDGARTRRKNATPIVVLSRAGLHEAPES